MTIRSKTVLKTYFNTGDVPTEINLADLIDSYDDNGTGSAAAATHNSSTAAHANIREAIGWNVLDYGATGDGSTDDTTAIQAAVNACEAAGSGGVILFPHGTYRITTTINIAEAIVLQGMSRMTQIFLDSATAVAVRFYNAAGISFPGVRDLWFECLDDSNNTRTAGSAIRMELCGDWLIENVRISNGWDAVYLTGSSSGIMRNVAISTDVATTTTLNNGVTVTGNCIGNRLENVTVNSTYAYNAGFLIESGTDTLALYGCGTNGVALYGVRLENTGAYHDPRWVYLTDCYFEAATTGNSVGIYVIDGGDIVLNNCYIAFGLYGMDINGARGVAVNGGLIQLARRYGVVIESGNDIDFNGLRVSNCSQEGSGDYSGILVVANNGNFKMTGVRSGNFLWGSGTNWDSFSGGQKYGIEIQAGTSNNYIITNCDLTDNVVGGLSDGGTGTSKIVDNNLPNEKSAYTITNPSADRAFNVAAVSLDELAAVLGTLIADIKTTGGVG